MAGKTQEVRTLMYSVVSGAVVTHRLPFNANDPIGRLKLQKFLQRGFTFDDPRIKASTGLPQVIVTQEVDLGKPIDASAPPEIEVALEDVKPEPPMVKGYPAYMSDNLKPVRDPFILKVPEKATRGRPRKNIKKGVSNG